MRRLVGRLGAGDGAALLDGRAGERVWCWGDVRYGADWLGGGQRGEHGLAPLRSGVCLARRVVRIRRERGVLCHWRRVGAGVYGVRPGRRDEVPAGGWHNQMVMCDLRVVVRVVVRLVVWHPLRPRVRARPTVRSELRRNRRWRRRRRMIVVRRRRCVVLPILPCARDGRCEWLGRPWVARRDDGVVVYRDGLAGREWHGLSLGLGLGLGSPSKKLPP